MTQVSKYAFSVDFAEPAAARKPATDEPEAPPPPTFSEDDLRAARDAGYAAGLTAGQAQALAGIEKRIETLLGGVGERAAALHADIESRQALAARDVAVLAGAIAGKIAGKRGADERASLIAEMAQGALVHLCDAPRVSLAVPCDLSAALETRIAAAGFAAAVEVQGDEDLAGADCRLTWRGGGCDRIEADIWRDIETLLARYIGESDEDPGLAAEGGTDAPASDGADEPMADSDAAPEATAGEGADETDPEAVDPTAATGNESAAPRAGDENG